MLAPATTRRQVQFGPFTVDLVSRELHGSNGKIRLQGLPFHILTILVERPGEWVTRDELRERLWPADTFVDFEHSINTAVGKLRRALGDDPDEPRYIETLPRHGYRLIAEVTEGRPQKASQADQKKFRKMAVPSAVLLLAALIAGWLFYPWRKANALTDQDTIVLADIDNKTGDEVFDDALKQALAVELEQSPFLNVLSDQKVSETLGMMGRPANEPITANVGREVCQRAGSKALLTGEISRLGSHYLIALNAVACSTGDTLAMEQGEAAAKEDVLKTLSRASSRLRTKLGETLPSVEKYDVPVDATTSSLEALRYFNIGLTLRRKEGDASGIPFLRRAIELDPNFPLAYSELALSYDNLEQPSRALEYASKAYQLRDRATLSEQLSITALYFSATGELDKEIQTYELWTASYPRNPVPRFNLGADYVIMGRYDKALPELQEGLRLAPGNVNVYTTLGAALLYLNRLDEAKATFDLALSRKLDDGGLRQFMYYLAFVRGDAAKMEEQVSWAAGKPGDEDLLLSLQSDTEAYYGRMSKARDFSRRAIDSAVRADSKETAAAWQADVALREAELGNTSSARQGAVEALALSPGRDVKIQAALALARVGDVARAETLVEELQKSYPTNTLLKFYWLPSINAAIELNRGNASGAIVLLEAAAPYELAGGLPLYPAYLRGQAYLLAHNGTAAAAEFQKLLDHKSIVQNFVTGSLAHLQIARAYAMAGDTLKAKAAYQDFFSLWKDADPGVSCLKQAKAEYAKLA
ncbi:MAG: winged helix-turn-helix domain-containing protein [Candidatus Sulfotelmatobacter sp.]